MLVLSRKVGNRICIADNIEITVLRVRGNKVRLGVTAPCDVSIDRLEVSKRNCKNDPQQQEAFTQTGP
jgi:carbon storage regulator